MRLLLIEDDIVLSKEICQQLAHHFVVDAVSNGDDGLYAATNCIYDAVILSDRMLEWHGTNLCQILRQQHFRFPIIFLTECNDTHTRVSRLYSGADDYLLKPICYEELTAKIFCWLRGRDNRDIATELTFGNFQLDVADYRIKYNGTEIGLRHKDFDLLILLVRNKNHTVNRDQIQLYVWGDEEELADSTIDVHINYLRTKIDKPYGTHYIETIHGIGFVLRETPPN